MFDQIVNVTRSRKPSGSHRTEDPQIVTTGTIKANNGGGEIITFSVYLGLFWLACIVNVPADGETEAPVYVKFKVKEPRDHG